MPEHIKEVRTDEIVGLDLQADGGTHVANTKEVGGVRVVDHQRKGKINKRIYIELEAISLQLSVSGTKHRFYSIH